MLPKTNRLNAGVRLIHPKSFATPLFLVKVAANNSPVNRYGIVISKKIDKRAVVRNRIRRIFQDEVRIQDLVLKKGFDLLFIIRSKDVIDNELFREEIQKVVRKDFGI